MWYIPLSSHFKNHPVLNAPLCNFIWLVLGWINFSCWEATGNNFALECCDLSFDMGGITRLSPPNVTQKTRLMLPGSGLSLFIACFPGNPPPWEGAVASWFSVCVVTFLLHWSRRNISELWQRRRQARLGECWGEEGRGGERRGGRRGKGEASEDKCRRG